MWIKQEPSGSHRNSQEPSGTLRNHQEPPGTIRISQEPSGSTGSTGSPRNSQEPSGTPRNRQDPQDPSGAEDPGTAFSPLGFSGVLYNNARRMFVRRLKGLSGLSRSMLLVIEMN